MPPRPLTDEQKIAAKERKRQQHKIYYDKHRDEIIAREKEKYRRTRESCLAYSKRYHEQHKNDPHRIQQLKETSRRYREKKKLELAAIAAARRVEKKEEKTQEIIVPISKDNVVLTEGTIAISRGHFVLGKDAWA